MFVLKKHLSDFDVREGQIVNVLDTYPQSIYKINELASQTFRQFTLGDANSCYELGLRWGGDRVSNNENTKTGWSAKMPENSRETNLSALDKYLLNFLMHDRLINYGYQSDNAHFYDYFIVPFFILSPLSFGMRFFSLNYIGNRLKSKNKIIIIKNIGYYIKRVTYFYYIFLNAMDSDFLGSLSIMIKHLNS